MERWLEVAPGIRVTGDGGVWIPAHGALVVADVHVGYELAAGRRGGWLPAVGRGADVAARLVRQAEALGATRLVIAGDLRHSTRDVDRLEREELAAFAETVRARLALDVVAGNHDRGGSLPGVVSPVRLVIGEIEVVHHPPAAPPIRWTVCGHLHPRITLRDETGAAARFPCAMVGERTVVVPAVSDWAGGTEARRLLPSLAPGPWRILPMVDGLVADMGMVMTSGEP